MKKIFYILTISLLFFSCASTRQFVEFPAYKATNQKARIYILRPSFVSVAIPSSIFCNNKLIGKTGGNGYLCWEKEEGEYTIASTQKRNIGHTVGTGVGEDVFTINAKAGNVYYLMQDASFSGGFVFRLLDNNKGKKAVEVKRAPKFNFI